MNNKRMMFVTLSVFVIALITYLGVNTLMNKVTYSLIDTDGNTFGEDTATTSCESISTASQCVARSDCSWNYSTGCTKKTITKSYRICLAMADGTYAEECNHYCDTDSTGKIETSCLNTMYSVCNKWSTIRWNEIKGSNNQGTGLSKEEFGNKVFTSTMTYYCVAGSSIHNSSGGSDSSGDSGSPATVQTPVDSFKEPVVTQTCSYDDGKTSESCASKAQTDCGSKGYIGCYKTDSNACYTYTCKSDACINSNQNTHESCVNSAKLVCGEDGYMGCATPNEGECYTFTCGSEIKTCEDNNGKNPEACRTRAALVCGENNYTGCTNANEDACYTFTCSETPTQSECSVDYGKNIGACKAKAQTECGDAGYTGCDNVNSAGCYIFNCNSGSTPPPPTTTDDNPTTGSASVFAVWIIGFLTIAYSLWYYKKVTSLNDI